MVIQTDPGGSVGISRDGIFISMGVNGPEISVPAECRLPDGSLTPECQARVNALLPEFLARFTVGGGSTPAPATRGLSTYALLVLAVAAFYLLARRR